MTLSGSQVATPVTHPPPAASAGPPRPTLRHLLHGAAVLVALACVVSGAALAATSYRDQISPEQVVLDYLAAVARGDAAGALAYGDLPAGDRDLLTSEVLAAQLAIAPMTGLGVVAVRTTPGRAAADVRYDLGFASGVRTVVDTIALTPDGRSWRLSRVAVPVSLSVLGAAHHATVAGAAVPKGLRLVFPGATPIAFDGPNLRLGESAEVVRFATGQDVAELAVLSAAGEEAVGSAVDAAVTACLDGTASEPTLCPLPPDVRAVPGTLRGRLGTPASGVVSTSLVPGNDALVRVAGELTVTGEYVALDYNNQRVTRSGDFALEVLLVCYASAPDAVIWRST